MLLNSVFLHESIDRLVDLTGSDSASLETFYIYSLVRFLFEQKRESEIDRIIPDIPQFCEKIRQSLLRSNSDESSQFLVFRNNIRCLQYLDISDDMCRSHILNLIRSLFSLHVENRTDLIINFDNVHILLQSLLNVFDSDLSFLRFVLLPSLLIV